MVRDLPSGGFFANSDCNHVLPSPGIMMYLFCRLSGWDWRWLWCHPCRHSTNPHNPLPESGEGFILLTPEFLSTLALTTQCLMALRTNTTNHSVACGCKQGQGPATSVGSSETTRCLVFSLSTAVPLSPLCPPQCLCLCYSISLFLSLLLTLYFIVESSSYKGYFHWPPWLGKFLLSYVFLVLL